MINKPKKEELVTFGGFVRPVYLSLLNSVPACLRVERKAGVSAAQMKLNLKLTCWKVKSSNFALPNFSTFIASLVYA